MVWNPKEIRGYLKALFGISEPLTNSIYFSEASLRNMEKATIDSASNAEEEYVLLDLGDVSLLDIPPNAPYVLSVCF